MGYLDQLKITNKIVPVAKRRQRGQTIEYRRNKLIANIEEQIELVGLAVQGKPLCLRRKRGHKVVNVRPRIWWDVAPDGHVNAQIYYNKVAMNLAGRGKTIEVEALPDLADAFRIVMDAVAAGELDYAIENFARKSQP